MMYARAALDQSTDFMQGLLPLQRTSCRGCYCRRVIHDQNGEQMLTIHHAPEQRSVLNLLSCVSFASPHPGTWKVQQAKSVPRRWCIDFMHSKNARVICKYHDSPNSFCSTQAGEWLGDLSHSGGVASFVCPFAIGSGSI
jgi:hypothetical protein